MAVYFNGTQVSTMYFGGTVGWGGTGTLQSQTFLTSGTFTVPANVRQLYVQCTGGGAGGYNSGGEASMRLGGGGSGMVTAFVHVIPGTAYTVTIGAPSGGNQLTNGGTTSFGALVSCVGGLTAYGRYGSFLNTGNSRVIALSGDIVGVFADPGIGGITAATVYTGGGIANVNYAVATAGGPGGFGSGYTSAGAANSGAGGGINLSDGTPYAGGSGRCVVYWFTYS